MQATLHPVEIAREQQIADALEALLPVLGHGDAGAIRSVRRLLTLLAREGPGTLRTDAAHLLDAPDKALRDGATAIARQLRGRQLGKQLTPVLLVEDDDLVCAALAVHLAPLGREILIAHDLIAAERFLQNPVGAVVLDLQLQGEEDGRDLLVAHGNELPFVVVSAIADRSAVQQECRALGARAVLPKPVFPQTLLESLQAVLRDEAPPPPEDAHLVALFRHRAHLTEADLLALAEGISDLTWDAAVRTHLSACDQCRERRRRALSD